MWWWFTCGFSTPPPCTARVDEGIRVRVTGLRVQGLPVYYLSFSVVVVGVEDRPPLGYLGRALRRRPALVLRGHPDVPPWLPHEGRANGEGGFGHGLVPPSAVLRQVFLGFCLRELLLALLLDAPYGEEK